MPMIDVDAAAGIFADRLASGPTSAGGVTKRVLHAWRSGGVATADALSHAEGPVAMRGQDVQDGLVGPQQYGPGHAVFNNR